MAKLEGPDITLKATVRFTEEDILNLLRQAASKDVLAIALHDSHDRVDSAEFLYDDDGRLCGAEVILNREYVSLSKLQLNLLEENRL